MQNPLKLQLL